jgi:hypothetical protein
MANLRPQVISNVRVLTSLIAPAGERNAAMIGTAQWGPINTVTSISSINNYVSVFGDETESGLTGIKGATQFFNNGGTVKFVRVVDGTQAKAGYMAENGTTDVIKFDAMYEGTYGNNIYVTIEANSTNRNVLVTDGTNREYYSNNGTGYSTNEAIATAINNGSNLVSATVETGQETTNLVDALAETQLTGGVDGAASITTTILQTAYDNLLVDEGFNYLLTPGFTDDSFYNLMQGKLETRAGNGLYSRLIGGIAKDETISTASARTSVGKRLTIVAPNVKATNRFTNAVQILDGSYLACAYAGKLCGLDLEISGTHETLAVEGVSINESTGKEYYNKNEQNELLNAGVAPITFIGNSLQMVRGITRIDDQSSVFFEEVVTDIADFVLGELEKYLETTIGKPNTPARRAVYASELDARLTIYQSQGVIIEFSPSVVEEGLSPDTIIATIGIKPTYNTNFVFLTLNIN